MPGTTTEILVLPILLCLFGALAWQIGLTSLDRGGKGWARILGGFLLTLAIIRGLQLLWNLYNPSLGQLYRLSISQKMVVAHYIAILLPFGVIAGFSAFAALNRRRKLDYD